MSISSRICQKINTLFKKKCPKILSRKVSKKLVALHAKFCALLTKAHLSLNHFMSIVRASAAEELGKHIAKEINGS
jgi:hypothetical protein